MSIQGNRDSGKGADVAEDTAVAKLKAKETWYRATPESEQWLLVKWFKLWQGLRGDRPGVQTVDMVLPGFIQIKMKAPQGGWKQMILFTPTLLSAL